MAPVRGAVLLSLLALTAGVPNQEASPAGQLAQLLEPVVESALTRVLSGWQPPALSDLSRMQARLEAVERDLAGLARLREQVEAMDRDLADLKLTSPAGGRCLQWAQLAVCQPQTQPEPDPVPEPEPEPEPTCDNKPSPLAAETAPHQEPAVRACARSCLQLRDQGVTQDGIYWLTGLPVPALCDFSHDGGGWTLLLTAASRDGWDPLSVLGRNQRSPSLTDNYSILPHAETIRSLGTGSRFAYRIEAQAQTGRRRWGGVWHAPRGFSFVHESPSQTDVSIVRKFDNWSYKDDGIEQRMPWLNTGSGPAVLTTSKIPGSTWWGTLVTVETETFYKHSPWIGQAAEHSGVVLYWMREEVS